MLKYNWQKLNIMFSYNEERVVNYFEFILNPEMRIKNLLRMKYKRIAELSNKPNFLYNPQDIMSCYMDVHFIYNYIDLASARSLFEFHKKGELRLPMWKIPNYALHRAMNNPLLQLKDGYVNFKYEQIKDRG